MREGFVFYKSWMDALDCLPPEEYKEAMRAILTYGLTGEEQDVDGVAKAMLIMAKPTIDKNNRRAENGKAGAEYGVLGGRPKKETPNKPQENPKETPNKPVQITDNSKQITDNINNNISLVPTEPGRHGDPVPYQAVIDYLNQVCGTKYHATTAKTRECIRARWREGARLEDFKRVIDRKARDWLNTDRAEYLRPETLFGEKFEGYLNAPESKPKKKAIQFNTFHQRDQNYEEIQKALLVKQMKA